MTESDKGARIEFKSESMMYSYIQPELKEREFMRVAHIQSLEFLKQNTDCLISYVARKQLGDKLSSQEDLAVFMQYELIMNTTCSSSG